MPDSRTVIWTTLWSLIVLLVCGIAAVSTEWPMPEFLDNYLKKQLAHYQIEGSWAKGYFDLTGNIRLVDVRAKYQGLVEAQARQILLSVRARRVHLKVDEGILHTGFLLLPVPESVGVSGEMELSKDRLNVLFARIDADPVMLLLQGQWPISHKNSESLLEENVDLVSRVDFKNLEKLWDFSSNWVAELSFSAQSIRARAWAGGFNWDQVEVEGPVISFIYPQNLLLAGAERLSGKWGQLDDLSLRYRCGKRGRWQLSAGAGSIHHLKMLGAVANGVLPYNGDFGVNAVDDISGRVFLPEGEGNFSDVTLNPLSAQINLQAKADFLQDWGVKLSSHKPVCAVASYQNHQLDFKAVLDAAKVWDYPVQGGYARGSVLPHSVQLNYWQMHSADGQGWGNLEYTFGSHQVRHRIAGTFAPYNLPWFGTWWDQMCDLIKQAKPSFVLDYQGGDNLPTNFNGVVGGQNFLFKRLRVDRGVCTIKTRGTKTTLNYQAQAGQQNAEGSANFTPTSREVSLRGSATPAALAQATLDQTPEALEKFSFTSLPNVSASEKDGQWSLQMDTEKPGKFYSLDFDYLKATVLGDMNQCELSPLEFGFASGQGVARAHFNQDGTGSGHLVLDQAKLGEWSLLGPLGNSLKGTVLGFSNLDLSAATADFVFSPDKVNVSSLELTGDEHAVSGSGSIDPKNGTVDFSVKLKTLGGTKPKLGLLAPIVQPFTSVVEAELSGPIETPKWHFKLTKPTLIMK